MAGLEWDVSWHRSIGRDTAFSPPHLLIYAAAAIAGLLSCALIALATGSRGNQRGWSGYSTAFAGFRSSFGGWVLGWGCLALLTSVPFDNWWHEAYGLDVKILSPPHLLFGTGLLAIEFGNLLLLLAWRKRVSGGGAWLDRALHYVMAMMILIGCLVGSDYLSRIYRHSSLFYLVAAMILVNPFVAFSHAAAKRWSATRIAGIYMIFAAMFTWCLPLFPATPRLGPVYHAVTHMTPPEFPLLLIVPALVLDWVRNRVELVNGNAQALFFGTAFFSSLVAVEWPFASFLMSPASQNWFFGTAAFGFDVPAGSDFFLSRFTHPEPSLPIFWTALLAAWFLSVAMARVGLVWGAWLSRIQR